eukprot:gb/GECH01001335.1/.p1 GENE.gb/GECH01001335.1/~~gb/GECH01001335.1/.p1  ORF type:complete len:449 (+),score=68.36 gb/GECH01001335.1/:1-1347(+)
MSKNKKNKTTSKSSDIRKFLPTKRENHNSQSKKNSSSHKRPENNPTASSSSSEESDLSNSSDVIIHDSANIGKVENPAKCDFSDTNEAVEALENLCSCIDNMKEDERDFFLKENLNMVFQRYSKSVIKNENAKEKLNHSLNSSLSSFVEDSYPNLSIDSVSSIDSSTSQINQEIEGLSFEEQYEVEQYVVGKVEKVIGKQVNQETIKRLRNEFINAPKEKELNYLIKALQHYHKKSDLKYIHNRIIFFSPICIYAKQPKLSAPKSSRTRSGFEYVFSRLENKYIPFGKKSDNFDQGLFENLPIFNDVKNEIQKSVSKREFKFPNSIIEGKRSLVTKELTSVIYFALIIIEEGGAKDYRWYIGETTKMTDRWSTGKQQHPGIAKRLLKDEIPLSAASNVARIIAANEFENVLVFPLSKIENDKKRKTKEKRFIKLFRKKSKEYKKRCLN